MGRAILRHDTEVQRLRYLEISQTPHRQTIEAIVAIVGRIGAATAEAQVVRVV